MKPQLYAIALSIVVASSAATALADTVITVTNGSGSYSTNLLSFNDANGVRLVLDGNKGTVTLTYPDYQTFSFPYTQAVSGLSVTGTWSGTDESGYSYTASVQESLALQKHSGSGRGGGYHTYTTTVLAGGKITYDYAGAYAPRLIAPVATATATDTTARISWSAASGGVPGYTYTLVDASGTVVADTTSTSVTLTGLAPSTYYLYTLVVTDSAGRTASTDVGVTTQAATLETVYRYDAATNSVTATWNPAPNIVSYSVFYYDWVSGTWIDGADTTGSSATVSGWSPDTYVSFYVAGYDALGNVTIYDQQSVYVQPGPPPPPIDN